MSHQTELDKKQTAFLFQEESVDVHPYLHTLPRKEFADPEIQLMLVVFEDALRSSGGTKNEASDTTTSKSFYRIDRGSMLKIGQFPIQRAK